MRNERIVALTLAIGGMTSVAAANEAVLNVDEDHLKDYWTRTKSEGSAPSLYPREAIAAAASGCVAAAYSVDADGRPGAAKILQSYITKKDGDEMRAHFERNVLANIATWRYLPAKSPGQPVYTYTIVVAVAEMGLHRHSVTDEVKAHCAVADFGKAADSATK